MAIALPAYHERRVVPVRWCARAVHGPPDVTYPEIDDRATRPPEFAPVVGLMAGCEAVVRLERENIDPNAELHVTSDNGSVSIIEPADGVLPTGRSADIRLKGEVGGNPNPADVEIRFGSKTGPIISVLRAHCYSRLRLVITPHIVTITDPDGKGGIRSSADPVAIVNYARAIWRPCGIDFVLLKGDDITVNLATPGNIGVSEFNELFATNWIPNTVNVYFVNELGGHTMAGTRLLGETYNRDRYKIMGLPHPGVVVADRAGSFVQTAQWAGAILAHELGHFMGLQHVNFQPVPTQREDTWARRMLMHPLITTGHMRRLPNDNGYGTINGDAGKGGLLTQKRIPHIATDIECTTARAWVLRGAYG